MWRRVGLSVAGKRAKSGWSRRVMLARVSECDRGPRFLGWDGVSVHRREARRQGGIRAAGAARRRLAAVGGTGTVSPVVGGEGPGPGAPETPLGRAELAAGVARS